MSMDPSGNYPVGGLELTSKLLHGHMRRAQFAQIIREILTNRNKLGLQFPVALAQLL